MQYKCTWLSFISQLLINKAFVGLGITTMDWEYIYDGSFNVAWHRHSWDIISWMYILKWGMLLAATNSHMYFLTHAHCAHVYILFLAHTYTLMIIINLKQYNEGPFTHAKVLGRYVFN